MRLVRTSRRIRHSSTAVIQVFYQARTAHLERLSESRDVALLYRTRSYDFDECVALDTRAQQLSLLGIAERIITNPPNALEINEPMFVRAWPTIVVASIAASIASLISRRRVRVVTYAIENGDVLPKLAYRMRPIPRSWAMALCRFALRIITKRLDQIAFGTEAARANYRLELGHTVHASRTFEALEPPCHCDSVEKEPLVLFLGALEERKGILDLVEAWPRVVEMVPEASLLIAGKGNLEQQVTEATGTWKSASVVVDPPRDDIHRMLRRAKVLVLPSKRTSSWREQVGLPIVEGLSHGTEIVTTRETGLALWLEHHDHQVIETSDGLVAALARALTTSRSAATICNTLPLTSGRQAAAEWMWRSTISGPSAAALSRVDDRP